MTDAVLATLPPPRSIPSREQLDELVARALRNPFWLDPDQVAILADALLEALANVDAADAARVRQFERIVKLERELVETKTKGALDILRREGLL